MEALKLSPTEAEGAASMGCVFLDEGDFGAAALAFTCAASVTNDGKHWAALGFCEQKQNHLEQAVAAYQRATERGINDVQTWANLGEAYIDLMHYGPAADALARAIALDPNGEHPASVRARALVLKAVRDLKAMGEKPSHG